MGKNDCAFSNTVWVWDGDSSTSLDECAKEWEWFCNAACSERWEWRRHLGVGMCRLWILRSPRQFDTIDLRLTEAMEIVLFTITKYTSDSSSDSWLAPAPPIENLPFMDLMASLQVKRIRVPRPKRIRNRSMYLNCQIWTIQVFDPESFELSWLDESFYCLKVQQLTTPNLEDSIQFYRGGATKGHQRGLAFGPYFATGVQNFQTGPPECNLMATYTL